MVMTKKKKTICREKNGSLMKSFSSLLPNGYYFIIHVYVILVCSNKTSDMNKTCILDCIFSQTRHCFYILDVLCWNDYIYSEEVAEFRFFFIDNTILQDKTLSQLSVLNDYKFVGISRYSCNKDGLRTVYMCEFPDLTKDGMYFSVNTCFRYFIIGILFYHKHATYWKGLTPYVLSWKDQSCCIYYIDTDDG